MMAAPETRDWSLDRLLDGLALAPRVPVTELAMDSREVRPGAVFLALGGTRRHGIEFADAAVQAGAAAIVTDLAPGDLRVQRLAGRAPVVAVPGVPGLAGLVAARFFDAPTAAMDVIGVTGTNGKTSVSWMIARALESLGRRAGLMGTLGWGTPDSLQDSGLTTPDPVSVHRHAAALAAMGCSALAVEASSHALDQARLAGTEMSVAVFTNLSRDHLDYHPDMAAYFAAKASLFEWPNLQARVIAVVDEWGERLAEQHPGAWLVGTPARARRARAVQITSSTAGRNGIRMELATPSGDVEFESALAGSFNVQNLAVTCAVLLALEVPLARTVEALQSVSAPPGRLQRIDAISGPAVFVDYAHTPAALGAALDALRAHVRGRVWCVFGCGGDRDRGKRPTMAAAAAAGADHLVLTSDNPRSEDPAAIIGDMLPGLQGAAHTVITARDAAIRHAIYAAGEDDTVLIAGKGHERFQIIGDLRRPFDDVQVATAALDAWRRRES